ncbi:aldose 1-epimerase [Trueperella sp. LYQ143]|uniref:aldose 1-epimerase n=1 Tax=Trueperella sp. LYQ143 TaxID=3391059 RepID=UPI0039831941
MSIQIAGSQQSLELTPIGAAILSWDPGVGYSVIDGYRGEQEIAELDGYRNAVLAPWCNRIRDALWREGETQYDTRPTSGPEGLHGMVYDQPFTVTQSGEGYAVLECAVENPTVFPVPVQVSVRYDLTTPRQIGIRICVRNDGDRPAPLGAGLHPYFRIAGLDQAHVEVPATKRIVVNEALIPDPGNAPFVDYEPAPFELDDDFATTDLQAGEDGWARARLVTGLAADVEVGMDVRQHPLANFHVYSGGMLARDTNLSVALEPCTQWADVFNRPELAERIMTQPGQSLTLDVTYTAIF